VARVPLVTTPTLENISYLATKQNKLGHRLESDAGSETSDLA
jgi:GTP cyclohydrolase II